MPSPKVSTSLVAILFGIAGLVVGFLSLGLIDAMFYTTKPLAFLAGWQILLFIALFAFSFALIPLAAACSPAARLIWSFVIWICTTGVVGFSVSIVAAMIHRQTSRIPDWLVPTGLLLVPIVSGIVMIVLPRFWRGPHESCT